MSKLARLIAKREGFGIPNALPTRDNNPGDLRHSPHSLHSGDPNAIGEIPTIAEGWEDLETQLQRYASRDLTVQQVIYKFAPPNENDTAAYLKFICDGMPCSPLDAVAQVLKVP